MTAGENEKISRENSKLFGSRINSFYEMYKGAVLKPDNGLLREYVGLMLQICISSFDLSEATRDISDNKYEGFALKVSLRPLILRAYELEMAISPWSGKMREIVIISGAPTEFIGIKGVREKNKDALASLRGLARARNTFGHSCGKGHADFIFPIENIDIDKIHSLCGAVMDCSTALLMQSAAILPYVQAYENRLK